MTVTTLPMSLIDARVRLTRWLAKRSIDLLRISLGVVFLGFGVLKFFPGASPAEALVARTVDTLLVLAPICPAPAFPVGADLDPGRLSTWPSALRTTIVVNLLGLPAVAIPTGVSAGLPQAVQIIGPRFREDLCLNAAAAIEARLPPLTPIAPRPGDGLIG